MIALSRQQQLILRAAFGLAGLVLAALSFSRTPHLRKVAAQGTTPALVEFRWGNSEVYRRLYYYQSSDRQLDWATYYLMLRPRDRRTNILKLNITIPDYFNVSIRPDGLSLCRMQLGGYLSRSRCKELIPAVFQVNEANNDIEVFPNRAISTEGTYAVVMKIFNPDRRGMFQFNALAQLVGELPSLVYLGSWLIDIN